MKLEKRHSFTIEEATDRMKALTTYWDTRYGTRTQWTGQSARITGKVKGIKFDGTFTVDDRTLRGNVDVGFLAERMGGRQYVEHKLDQYLDAGTALDQLKRG